MITEDSLQVAARALHEAIHGKGSWKLATKEERSSSRHLVRVVVQSLAVDEAAPAARPQAVARPITAAPRIRANFPKT